MERGDLHHGAPNIAYGYDAIFLDLLIVGEESKGFTDLVLFGAGYVVFFRELRESTLGSRGCLGRRGAPPFGWLQYIISLEHAREEEDI